MLVMLFDLLWRDTYCLRFNYVFLAIEDDHLCISIYNTFISSCYIPKQIFSTAPFFSF